MRKTMTGLLYTVNAMAVDGLATKGGQGINSHGIDLAHVEWDPFQHHKVS